MENEIIEYKAGELASHKVHFEKNGLVIDEGTTFKEWEEIGLFLKETNGAIQWWIGDWINFGEHKYGEKYAQALDYTDYSLSSLWRIRNVSARFGKLARERGLPWSIYKLVAPLNQEESEKWLDYAENNRITNWEVLSKAIRLDRLKEEGSNYDNLVDFIDHMKAYANEVLQLADALHEKRIFVSPNQKQIILDQASLIHGLWDNLEYELRKG
jgi:hypothetical protein